MYRYPLHQRPLQQRTATGLWTPCRIARNRAKANSIPNHRLIFTYSAFSDNENGEYKTLLQDLARR